jgi:hypothetical protein
MARRGGKLWWIALPLGLAGGLAARAETPIDQAFNRLYNFDFKRSQEILDRQHQLAPLDPLPLSVNAASYLFSELHRLKILELDFFTDDDKVVDRKALVPDPAIRQAFLQLVEDSERLANARLASRPDDRDALFALCMATGLETDYAALIERRRFGSFSLSRRNQVYARKLLALNPPVDDAYMTFGTVEYVVGSLPFFVRWFVHLDQVTGSKQKGIEELELVARRGRYYGPLARMMLAVIHIREKRPDKAEQLLAGLAAQFPENPLFGKELLRVRRMTHPTGPARAK